MVRVSPPTYIPNRLWIPNLNALLAPLGRERLLYPQIVHEENLAYLTVHVGISIRTAYTWLDRYYSGGALALVDRRSVGRTQRQLHDHLHR